MQVKPLLPPSGTYVYHSTFFHCLTSVSPRGVPLGAVFLSECFVVAASDAWLVVLLDRRLDWAPHGLLYLLVLHLVLMHEQLFGAPQVVLQLPCFSFPHSHGATFPFLFFGSRLALVSIFAVTSLLVVPQLVRLLLHCQAFAL